MKKMDKEKDLRNFARNYIATIWKIHKMGGPLKGDEKRLVNIMEEHKEYYKIWDNADRIGDKECTVKGVNPFLHVQFHLIVERQLAMGKPKIVKEVAEELNKLGLSHHEIVHLIATPLSNQLFDMLKNKVLFDEDRYSQDLKKIVEEIKNRQK
jgi:hypothetical protein